VRVDDDDDNDGDGAGGSDCTNITRACHAPLDDADERWSVDASDKDSLARSADIAGFSSLGWRGKDGE
jgi:hypothetical protein